MCRKERPALLKVSLVTMKSKSLKSIEVILTVTIQLCVSSFALPNFSIISTLHKLNIFLYCSITTQNSFIECKDYTLEVYKLFPRTHVAGKIASSTVAWWMTFASVDSIWNIYFVFECLNVLKDASPLKSTTQQIQDF